MRQLSPEGQQVINNLARQYMQWQWPGYPNPSRQYPVHSLGQPERVLM